MDVIENLFKRGLQRTGADGSCERECVPPEDPVNAVHGGQEHGFCIKPSALHMEPCGWLAQYRRPYRIAFPDNALLRCGFGDASLPRKQRDITLAIDLQAASQRHPHASDAAINPQLAAASTTTHDEQHGPAVNDQDVRIDIAARPRRDVSVNEIHSQFLNRERPDSSVDRRSTAPMTHSVQKKAP